MPWQRKKINKFQKFIFFHVITNYTPTIDFNEFKIKAELPMFPLLPKHCPPEILNKISFLNESQIS